jgi:archaeal preflagellin peptidase FlaK
LLDFILVTREIIAFGMLITSSYFDIKTRQINDKVWIFFAIPGILLYFFSPISLMTLLFMTTGIIIGVIWFVTGVFGQADGLAMVTLSLVLPVLHDTPIAILVGVATIILVGFFGISYNIAYNLSDMFNGKLFFGINEKNHRKILAFLTMHKRRNHEKFVIKSQRGDKFMFHFKPEPNEDFAKNFNGFVSSAFPLLPFMLVALLVVILV